MDRFQTRPAPELVLVTVLFLLALAAMGLAARAQEAPEEAPSEEVPPPIEGSIPYEVRIEGPKNEALRETILEVSDLMVRQEAGVPSRAALRRRLQRDLEMMRKVMHSGAYYDAAITGDVDRGDAENSLVATANIEDGIQFRMGKLKVDYLGQVPKSRPKLFVPEGPATGATIKAIEQQIVNALLEKGHADTVVKESTATLNRAAQTVDLHYAIEAGPIVRIGRVSTSGLRDVHADHVLITANFREGELLTPSRVLQAEKDLAETGLFEAFRIVPEDKTADGRPMRIEVTERLHRTIGGGVKWASDEGFGVKGFWRHRNYYGGGELVTADLELAQIKQFLNLSYREPYWQRRDQALLLTAEVGHEDGEAFDESRAGVTAGLEREFSPQFIGRLGVGVEWSSSDDGTGRVDSYLLSVPGSLSWDYANDLLDPTEGYRVGVRVVPYVGYSDNFVGFLTTEGSGSLYLPLDTDRTWVFATRGRIGATFGPGTAQLPPNKRFYAGGGGSIRGYGYQRVGLLDASDNPIGGKSVIEMSAEIRARLFEDIGLVAFVDAGSAFEELTPRFDDDVGYAVGLGGRYYSSLGPIRLDVAVPLNKREGDEAFQIYVSIGQAF
jgi:translocation and assembly module TamA